MSQFLVDFCRECFARTGGGSNKRRCKTHNPSTAKLHGPLPSQDQLHEFEQSYAGANTPELMERYSAWSSGSIKRNKTCLICLKSTRSHDKTYLVCDTCPRTVHFGCLNMKAPHIKHERHCLACVKRRWHIIKPVTHVQRQDQSDEDYYMQRTRRYHRWHRYNCQHVDEWLRLYDDGSLESDRALLMTMGVTKHKPVSIGAVTEGNGTDQSASHKGQKELDRAAQPESEPIGLGEAAEYYDPDASRLGTAVGSNRSDHSHHSAAGHRSRASQAGSVSPRRLRTRSKSPALTTASIGSRASRKPEPPVEQGQSPNVHISITSSDSEASQRHSEQGSMSPTESRHSHQRGQTGGDATEMSRASTGASSDTSRDFDQRSRTDR